MSSIKNQPEGIYNEEEALKALELATGMLVNMVFKAAVELHLLEIMASAGPGKQLSPKQIMAQLPTQNPDAPEILDRILRLLASYSIFTCSQVTADDGSVQRLYGLTPVCGYYLLNEHGTSMSPFILMVQHKANIEGCSHFKDAVLEGGTSFNKAHGMEIYEYLGMDPGFNEVFNKAMFNLSIPITKGILEIYDGFAKANVVVDVGGGLGENLNLITSKYPMIKGINFDLPHVLADAPAYPGVEHVAGDMFLSVPKGDIIVLKLILHNWSDDHCLKILKNCYEALPEDGKVVVGEVILPETPETDSLAKIAFRLDVLMLAQTIGGKERTEKEYKALAMDAGFNDIKFISRVFVNAAIMEFHKKM